MSELSLFLKDNKVRRENAFFAATKSLLNQEGQPLLWEVRPITTREDEAIREQCTFFDSSASRFRLNPSLYMAKLSAAAVVEPNLYNATLQNSYDCATPEELLREMLDDPAEYQAFVKFVQSFGDFSVSMEERVENAKN
ncbi:MAG: hypothetical protein FWD35_01610 [Oscillospiraceae bacterium]|nr:hypothetical protein [Oscillospiraceae bacterium]